MLSLLESYSGVDRGTAVEHVLAVVGPAVLISLKGLRSCEILNSLQKNAAEPTSACVAGLI